MYQFLLVSIVIISCLLIFLVLMQQGKGADAGAAFGSGAGASGTVFGAQGSGNFLTRMTAVLATLFFIACLALSYLIANKNAGVTADESVIDRAIQEGVIQDLPGASNAIVPGADLPGAGVALEGGDLPAASGVAVEVQAGEALNVDMPVVAPQVEGINIEGAVGEQIDTVSGTITDGVDAVSGTITEGLDAITDQAQELMPEPELELDLPTLPVVE